MSAAKAATTYDLMVLLEPEREQAERARILANCRRMIEAQGELVRHDPWGVRELAYPIKHHRHAEYHLFQFRPASPQLLRELDRTLRISDAVLRFRIVKLAPGTPEPPPVGDQQAEPSVPAEGVAQAEAGEQAS